MTRKLWPALLAVALVAGACTKTTPPAEEVDRVAILVIDNFQPVPVGPAEAEATDNCPYIPEGVNVVGDQGAGDDLPDGVSHGQAVYTLLARELDSTPGLHRATGLASKAEYGLDPDLTTDVMGWSYRDREVLLVGVDTDQTTTAEIGERVRQITESMQNSSYGFGRFVLNMSFVIAPCNVPLWLNEVKRLDVDKVIEAYQALIAENPGLGKFQSALDDLARDTAGRESRMMSPDRGDGLETIRQRAAISQFYVPQQEQPSDVVGRIQSDPLKTMVGELNARGPRVIPVAAAGNGLLSLDNESGRLRRHRFDFPFAPAIWNSVVSVSARDPERGERAAYSNSGEVLMDGVSTVDRPGGGSATVHGTSFAAPRLAARHAIYLLRGGAVTCDGHLPALGYTNSDAGAQQWADLTVEGAAAAHCDDFAARANLSPASGP